MRPIIRIIWYYNISNDICPLYAPMNMEGDVYCTYNGIKKYYFLNL